MLLKQRNISGELASLPVFVADVCVFSMKQDKYNALLLCYQV